MAYIGSSLTWEKIKRYGISTKNTLYFAFQLDVGEKIKTVLIDDGFLRIVHNSSLIRHNLSNIT